MEALCPGVQYGMSTAENFSENKTLIFVKLTDSAYSAVQQHIHSQSKLTRNPTIQFLGDEGELSFPTLQNEAKTFKFNMSSTADIEGPGGSFECIQQTGSPRGSLRALGTIPIKIRTLANEDVYDLTRKRVSAAEEIQKNKCTREIKPNQGDIGRKVKLKQTMPARSLPTARREPALRDSLSSKPSFQNLPPKSVHSSNGLSNAGSSGIHPNHRVQNKPSSASDISKRPIKERLIHLLALRPHKKPELYDRLNKEGVREKMAITTVLKQVSYLKDNAYHLNRAMWNDVNDDWPFYTESEKKALKRQKPQNLTPPGSSDGGSSGSGHSPTSNHPGSPPPPISIPNKRPGYFDGNDGLPTKRPRISHYQKTIEHQVPPPYRSPIENINGQRRPVTDSRDASNMNPRSRESPSNPRNRDSPSNSLNDYSSMNGGSSLGYGMLNDKRNYSDDDEIISSNNSNRKRDSDSHNSVKYGVSKRANSNLNGSIANGNTNNHSNNTNGNTYGMREFPSLRMRDSGTGSPSERVEVASCASGDRNSSGSSLKYDHRQADKSDRSDRERATRWSAPITQNSSAQNRVPHVSPDTQLDILARIGNGSSPLPPNVQNVDAQLPDYLTEYTSIKTQAQRKKYKDDFSADYNEYKELHFVIEKVSHRFEELEALLSKQEHGSESFKRLQDQIIKEYGDMKKDEEHQRMRTRFGYLYDKLSHIKRLVQENDKALELN